MKEENGQMTLELIYEESAVDMTNEVTVPTWEIGYDELEELVATAGAVTVGRVIQNLDQVHPGTYVGKGKLEEIKELLWETGATGIIFSLGSDTFGAILRGIFAGKTQSISGGYGYAE